MLAKVEFSRSSVRGHFEGMRHRGGRVATRRVLAVPLKTLCEIAEEFWTSTRRDLWRTFGRGGNNFNRCCRDHGHGDFI